MSVSWQCMISYNWFGIRRPNSMTDKRPWTEEEDKLLKYVFETSKISKWSHIARILQD